MHQCYQQVSTLCRHLGFRQHHRSRIKVILKSMGWLQLTNQLHQQFAAQHSNVAHKVLASFSVISTPDTILQEQWEGKSYPSISLWNKLRSSQWGWQAHQLANPFAKITVKNYHSCSSDFHPNSSPRSKREFIILKVLPLSKNELCQVGKKQGNAIWQ